MRHAIAAQMLVKHAGLTQREAATVAGMSSGGAVGQQQCKLREALPGDRKLCKLIKQIETHLLAQNKEGRR